VAAIEPKRMHCLKPQCAWCQKTVLPGAFLIAASLSVSSLACAPRAFAQQTAAPEPLGEVIGTIEGNAIALKGPMSVQVVGNEVKTLLRSGVDVRVKSGHARIDLAGGGTIAICGPAHISLLKAANGLTIALDSGTIHARIEGNLALTVFTTQILAKPISIGDAQQDVLVGYDTPGLMCVRAARGAIRLQEQFGNQSVVVPQGADVTLPNGQLDGLRGNTALCACDPYVLETAANSKGSAPETSAPEISTPAVSEDVRKNMTLKNPLLPKKNSTLVDPPKPAIEPTYQIYMPALRYDASQKVQDEPDPKLILMVRRVRVRPTLIFESRVEGEARTVEAKALTADSAKPQPLPTKPASNTGLMDRVKTFLKSLWTPSS
jgi:hypothetical protein